MDDPALKLMKQSRQALQGNLAKAAIAAAEYRKRYQVKQAEALDLRRQIQSVDNVIQTMNGGPPKGFTDDLIAETLTQILADGPITLPDLEAEIAIQGLPMTRAKAILKSRIEFTKQGSMYVLRSSLYPEPTITE